MDRVRGVGGFQAIKQRNNIDKGSIMYEEDVGAFLFFTRRDVLYVQALQLSITGIAGATRLNS